MKIFKFYNRYELIAQCFPALITLIPASLIIFVLKKSSWFSIFQSTSALALTENIGLSFVALFVLMQFQRFLAKYYLEKKLFTDGIRLPTTQMLLFADGRLSKSMKKRIRRKILRDFNFTLSNEEEEKSDLDEALKLIIEAVALIRSKVRDGRLCINYNIQYGFFRNLIAGAFFAIPLSLFSLVVCTIYSSKVGIVFSSLSILFYFGLFLLRNVILNNLSESYAKNLFTEYISHGGE